MTPFSMVAIVLCITAVFAVINDKYIKLHRTIGVMLIALVMSLIIIAARHIGLLHEDLMTHIIANFNFDETLIQGMLGALLFAGAINIRAEDIRPRLVVITVLAIAGVLISTLIVGYLIYFAAMLLDMHIPLMYCLTFGALISPTDPIAVLAILRSIGVSKGLDMDICGETLFNDGIGLVAFTFFFSLAVNNESMTAVEVSTFFVRSVGGGIILGALCGYLACKLIGMVDDDHIEIMLTIALVFGCFQLAEYLHVSPAIAIVIVGLVFANMSEKVMTEPARATLYTFWSVIDEVLNTVLFVLVGIISLLVPVDGPRILLAVIAIAVVLFGRWVSVLAPVSLLKKRYYFSPRSVRILTWGGLRGGLSIAMVLSLPESREKEIILIMTYAVVVFSILVQGTTIAKVAGARTTYGNEYNDPRLNELSDDGESLPQAAAGAGVVMRFLSRARRK